MTVKGLTINEAEYDLENGEKGKLAVLIYAGEEDPGPILDWAVENYTKGAKNHEFIDSKLNCPWVRVILSNINDLKQFTWEQVMRDLKINKILK